jgi:hypothetical protein
MSIGEVSVLLTSSLVVEGASFGISTSSDSVYSLEWNCSIPADQAGDDAGFPVASDFTSGAALIPWSDAPWGKIIVEILRLPTALLVGVSVVVGTIPIRRVPLKVPTTL